jgi:NADPH:quinone reductase-like Zn-dependent oxidoreductase
MDMDQELPLSGLALTSTVARDGLLRLQLADVPIRKPADDEVVVQVHAAPIHPADLIFLLAGANPAEADFHEIAGRPVVEVPFPAASTKAVARRLDRAVGVGLEGAGVVVAAGANVRSLLGTRVAFQCSVPGSFGEFVTLPAAACIALADTVTFRQGAGAFCNPLTVLAMVETLHQTGERALIHTAAASSLGQMLVRICQEDGIALVNIVRRPAQAALLRELGAHHVCDSSAPNFEQDLTTALQATKAKVAFDAIGGGTTASELLIAMEEAAAARMTEFAPYGSMEPKQVYIYGRLDPTPTLIGPGAYGMVWSVDGWAMPPILAVAGPERTRALTQRIADGLTTTFASDYRAEISLQQMLQREVMLDYCRKETGGKYLLTPTAH